MPIYGAAGKAVKGECYDEEAAELAVEFFSRYLSHSKGPLAQQAFVLEPWQADMIRTIFGCKLKDGNRRYRTVYCQVPRKNGKTTLAAGIALLLLFFDREEGAEIYSAASDKEQASICFDLAKQMIERSPALRKRAKLYRKAIEYKKRQSIYKPISRDAGTKHGFNASGVIADELHVWPDGELWDVLGTSVGARAQPLIIAITTAGKVSDTSVCYEQYLYACQVRDGLIQDQTYLPVIYEAVAADDWKAEATWCKANPSLGVGVSLEYLRSECGRAQRIPRYENRFKQLHLDMWTEQAVRWLPIDLWDACKRDFTAESLRGRPCYGGLDLGSTGDLTAFVLLFPELEGETVGGYWCLPYFWVPENGLWAKTPKRQMQYLPWINSGHIRQTPGSSTDYSFVRRDINQLANDYGIGPVAIDRLFQGAQMGTDLRGDGFDVQAFGMGFYSMAAPSKRIEELLLEEKLWHDGNPVLRWMVGNSACEEDAAGNVKPSKAEAEEKIDGLVALLMALGQSMTATQGFEMFFM